MRMSVAVAATAALLGALVSLAPSADAACALGDASCTGVSFSVSAGTIALVAPASVHGGAATSAGTGATVDISLGATTVTDLRVGSTGWSVSATVSDFVTDGATIDKSNVTFAVPADATGTGLVGAGLCSTAQRKRKATPTAVDRNGTAAGIFACTQSGLSGATYTPVLTVTVPAGSLAGTYTGTVTQSVA